jgi:hypothetical protein
MTSDTPADQAFTRAAAPLWDGKLLKPLSARRLIAAQSCGLRIFKISASPTGEDPGLYDGIFWDAVIVVYLCTAPDSESLRAVRDPGSVSARALAWAEEQEIGPASPRFAELIQIFGEMIEEIMTSATAPAEGPADSDGAEKKTVPSPGWSNSPSGFGASPAETQEPSL